MLARVPATRELLLNAFDLTPWERDRQANQFERWRRGEEPSAVTATAIDIALVHLGRSRHKPGEECGVDRNGRRYVSHRTVCIHAGLAPVMLPTDDRKTRGAKWRRAMRTYFLGHRELREALGAIGDRVRFKPQQLDGCDHKPGCFCAENRARRQGLTRDSWQFATLEELQAAHARLLGARGKPRRIRETRKGKPTRAAGVACPQRSKHRAKRDADHCTPDEVIRDFGSPFGSPLGAPSGVHVEVSACDLNTQASDPNAPASDHRPPSDPKAFRITSIGSPEVARPSSSSPDPDPPHSAETHQADSPSAHRPSGPYSTPPPPAPTSQTAAPRDATRPRAEARSTPAQDARGFATRSAAQSESFDGGGGFAATPREAALDGAVEVIARHRKIAGHAPLPAEPVELELAAARLAKFTPEQLADAAECQQRSELNRRTPFQLSARFLYASDDRVSGCLSALPAIRAKEAKARAKRDADLAASRAQTESGDVVDVQFVSVEGLSTAAIAARIDEAYVELDRLSDASSEATARGDWSEVTRIGHEQQRLTTLLRALTAKQRGSR